MHCSFVCAPLFSAKLVWRLEPWVLRGDAERRDLLFLFRAHPYSRIFAFLDTDGNGRLSYNEVTAPLARLASRLGVALRATQIVRIFDPAFAQRRERALARQSVRRHTRQAAAAAAAGRGARRAQVSRRLAGEEEEDEEDEEEGGEEEEEEEEEQEGFDAALWESALTPSTHGQGHSRSSPYGHLRQRRRNKADASIPTRMLSLQDYIHFMQGAASIDSAHARVVHSLERFLLGSEDGGGGGGGGGGDSGKAARRGVVGAMQRRLEYALGIAALPLLAPVAAYASSRQACAASEAAWQEEAAAAAEDTS